MEKTPKRFPKLSPPRVILVVTALIAVYFLVAGALNAIRAHQLRQEEGRVQADIQDLQGRYERLEALKDYLNSDEYIESIAREQLGLVRKGESGFVAAPASPSPSPDPNETPAALWWDVLIR